MSQEQLFPEAAAPSSLPAHTYVLPDGAPIRRCRICGMPVAYASTPRGAQVPLSLATVALVEGDWTARSHFTDCDQASAWGNRRNNEP